MNRNSIENIFAEATAELGDVSKQFEYLSMRKAQIEALLESLRPFLPLTVPSNGHIGKMTPVPQPRTMTSESEKSTPRQSPNGTKDMIVAALRKAGKPLSVPDIYRAIEAAQPLQTPNRDAIRILMMRRADIFSRLGDGLYTLVDGFNTPASNAVAEQLKQDLNDTTGW